MLRFRFFPLLTVIVFAGVSLACDPLAPDSTPVVVVVTRTPPPTKIPTLSAGATEAGSTPASTAASIATAEPLTEAAPPASTAAEACTDTEGQVFDLHFTSTVAKTEIKYRAYVPPCYAQTTRRYPYVILMPGSDGDQTEWTDTLKVNAAADKGLAVNALPPMVLIMPADADLMNLNAFPDLPSWETVIVNEMIPEIEKNFCTWNDRESRAIGGISRGGFWAFEIAFRHPELFGAIGGHSPFFDPTNSPPAVNPMSLAKTLQFAPGMIPRIWIDVGKDDSARPNIEILEKTLAGRNIDPGYTLNPTGDHSPEYWSAHVAEYLSFYGQTWPRNVEDLPSCLQ